MVQGFGRTILALVVVIVIGSLSSIEVPDLRPDGSNYSEFMFWFQIKSAVGYFLAVAVGAVVARKNFIVPAVALSIFAWLFAIYVLYEIVRVAGPTSLAEIGVSNLYGLVLSLAAAVFGATLGRWFYRREFEHASSAS